MEAAQSSKTLVSNHYAILHGTTTQKTANCIFTTKQTSNLARRDLEIKVFKVISGVKLYTELNPKKSLMTVEHPHILM
jgi:hypothetical protein